MHVFSIQYIMSIMEPPLLPRESGRFIAERSRDVFVEEEGVQKVAEMLYSLRHSDDLTASGWKKANPLAPEPTSDQGSLTSESRGAQKILFSGNSNTWSTT